MPQTKMGGLLLRKTKNQKQGNQLQGHLKWSQPKIMLLRTRLVPMDVLIYETQVKVQTRFTDVLVMGCEKQK